MQEIVQKLMESRRNRGEGETKIQESQTHETDATLDESVENEESETLNEGMTDASKIGMSIVKHVEEINKAIDQLQALIPDAKYANGLKTHFDQKKVRDMVAKVSIAIDKELGLIE